MATCRAPSRTVVAAGAGAARLGPGSRHRPAVHDAKVARVAVSRSMLELEGAAENINIESLPLHFLYPLEMR